VRATRTYYDIILNDQCQSMVSTVKKYPVGTGVCSGLVRNHGTPRSWTAGQGFCSPQGSPTDLEKYRTYGMVMLCCGGSSYDPLGYTNDFWKNRNRFSSRGTSRSRFRGPIRLPWSCSQFFGCTWTTVKALILTAWLVKTHTAPNFEPWRGTAQDVFQEHQVVVECGVG